MSEDIPCTYCGRYYGHLNTCLSFLLYSKAYRELQALDAKMILEGEFYQEITRLKKALEIANEAIGFYAKEDNWLFSPEYEAPSIRTEIKLDHDCQVGCSGKRAREAQKQIKEVMEEK